MIFTQENPGQINQIQAYDANSFMVNGQSISSSLIILPDAVVQDWHREGIASLNPEDFSHFLDFRPELVLLGTGRHQHFPPLSLQEPLVRAQVGFEVMDTGSACRTFNLLAMEGRFVLAALLLNGQE